MCLLCHYDIAVCTDPKIDKAFPYKVRAQKELKIVTRREARRENDDCVSVT